MTGGLPTKASMPNRVETRGQTIYFRNRTAGSRADAKWVHMDLILYGRRTLLPFQLGVEFE